MKLTFSDEKNATVMKICGEIDHRYAIMIRNEADRKIVTYPDKKFIIDLSQVSFMDSSGIGVIIGRYKLIKSFGGQIAISGVNSAVGKILEMSGIKKIIPFFESVNDAMDNLDNQ